MGDANLRELHRQLRPMVERPPHLDCRLGATVSLGGLSGWWRGHSWLGGGAMVCLKRPTGMKRDRCPSEIYTDAPVVNEVE